MPGPLLDLKILDLSRLLPGPYATMLMADLGAHVIKVESPQAPDYFRMLPPFFEGTSTAFLTLNRNKRSLLARFDTPAGQEVLRRLIAWADVLVESNRTGFLERLGLGPAAALECNPRLVYCSLTGFGQHGSHKDRAGHDLNFLALSGVGAALRQPSGEPVVPGLQIADLVAGQACVSAVLAALWERQRSGRGQHLDLGLAEATLSLALLQQAEQLAVGQTTPTPQAPLGGAHPFYRYYRCRDGGWLAVAALEPKFQQRLRQALPQLDWPTTATWAAQPDSPLHGQLEALFASHDRDHWVSLLGDLDVCVEPLLEPAEVSSQSWVRQRHLVRQVCTEAGTPLEQPGGILDGAFPPAQGGFGAVAAGRHTREILHELGYSDPAIDALQASGDALTC